MLKNVQKLRFRLLFLFFCCTCVAGWNVALAQSDTAAWYGKRDGLIAPLDMNAGVPLDCLAYKFDIVLRGRRSTLFENRLEGN